MGGVIYCSILAVPYSLEINQVHPKMGSSRVELDTGVILFEPSPILILFNDNWNTLEDVAKLEVRSFLRTDVELRLYTST
jgi:hypothetical protein